MAFAVMVFACLCGTATRASAEAAPFVWLEAESATATPATFTPKLPGTESPDPLCKIEGSEHPDFLSDQKWLRILIDAGKVAEQVPPEGIVLAYPFDVAAAGNFDLWNRIGFEAVRSPFEWRVDGGEWKTLAPTELGTDLVELSFFCDVDWIKLGTQPLAAGPHKLEIRLSRGTDASGKPTRILYGSDALCVAAAGTFTPYSHFRPGEDHRTDADKQAEQTLFTLPAPASANPGERTSVRLKGLWQICRADEKLPGPVDVPIAELPVNPRWSAIPVPSDKQTARPDLMLAHRVWYRTRVEVPKEAIGRSFVLHFPQNNLNTTVFVNGTFCGFSDTPLAHIDMDVTKGMKAGINEIWVGIRDPYYANRFNPNDPMVLRNLFKVPLETTNRKFADMVYAVHGTTAAGILQTPTLTAAGSVYASDVFVKPSVAKKELAAEVTLSNSAAQPAVADITCEAVDIKSGAVAVTLPQASASVPAGGSQMVEVRGPWSDPKLWWPDDPNLYLLRTTTRVAGNVVDVQSTRFGFREWTIQGKDFLLNGVVWHGWGDLFYAPNKEAWLDQYKKNNATLARLCGASQGGIFPFFGLNPDDTLDFFDENGVVVRRCGPMDGEVMNYHTLEDPVLGTKWKEQLLAQVKGERNHPAIQLWSLENEVLFINAMNGGKAAKWEPVVTEASNAVRALDPTRATMVDGGGALKDNSLPVHGDHYINADLTKLPGAAYEPQVEGGGRKRWTWDQQRPRFIGEDFFLSGNHPELSTIGGEAAFGGKLASQQATGLVLSIAQQGYRWADFGGWQFWVSSNDSDTSYYKYFAPRVALVREWDWTFASGSTVPRTIGLFNDSHSADPFTLTWSLSFDGKKVAGESKSYTVAPGTRMVVPISLPMPKVTARAEGELSLSVAVSGKEVWSDTKAVSVLKAPAVPASVAALGEHLLLLDPSNTVGDFLAQRHIRFTRVADLKSLPESGKVLLIAKDAIDKVASSATQLSAWASTGRAVIVLEQQNPLHYQALPCEMDAATNEGRVGFSEDLNHPVFEGLAQKDFFTWNDDQILYRNAYAKPVRGAKSLLQCDDSLQNSALAEVPAGKGVLLLSQLAVGEKISTNPVAQALLVNMLNYAATYKQIFAATLLVADPGSPLAKAVDEIGLQCAKKTDPLQAIAQPGSVVVLQATTENLKTLAANLPKVREFTKSGGWLILNGLTPEGLESYNKLVGVEHMIRPFGSTKPTLTKDGPMAIERVQLATPRSRLTAGLSASDVTLYSSKRIFGFQGGCYTLGNEFSYVVDIEDVAPFATSPFPHFGNITNGFTHADGWPLIINFPAPAADAGPFAISLTLPKAQTIREFTWVGNAIYWPATRISLVFDGDTAHPATYDVAPNDAPQVLPVNPPRPATEITLKIEKWDVVPDKRSNLGIDNIYLNAERPADFFQKVHPMLNIGAMVEYPQGKGGIVLCNINFTAAEEVPANAVSKQKMLSTILRNLHAPFGGGKEIIAGADLAYGPVDISKQATQFRNERGWFGDQKFTIADLPVGKVKLAGVNYDIFDFPTSPVPTALMLNGPGAASTMPPQITGIPVNRTADALFFLQTAKMGTRRTPKEIKDGVKNEMFHYVVHYADGKSVDVPVYAEIDIDDFKQQGEARAIAGAQTAWTAPYAGTPFVAAAYSMQWNNPRPDVAISTIDMAYGNPKIGTPVLLALTAAKSK